MGLLVKSEIRTAEGITLPGCYCRITVVRYDVTVPNTIMIRFCAYVSRERRLENCRPINIPRLVMDYGYDSNYETLGYHYSILRSRLEAQGYTVEDVLEDDQQVSTA